MRLVPLLLLLAMSCGPIPVEAPNADPDAVFSWLADGSYAGYRSETKVLPGLVRGGRKVYLNEIAAAAVREHVPANVGALGVRELFGDDLQTQEGWAVVMKTERGWYYYETFDLVDPGRFSVAGYDEPTCAGCHQQAAGVLRSAWPLD